MGVGIGIGPNGQIGPVVTFDSTSSKPSKYESHFETPEGVQVSVVYNTDNNAIADSYEASIATQLSWKIVENHTAPSTRLGDMALAFFMSFVISLIAFGAGFVIAIMLNVVDLLPSAPASYYHSDFDYAIGKIGKFSVWLCFICMVLFPVWAGILWKSDSRK